MSSCFARAPGHLIRPRLQLEPLEDRVALSWAGIPPATIAPPANAVAVSLNAQKAAQGTASITANEVDFYSFVAPSTGSYRISALTPSSNLDTVLGVFNAAGTRIAYNDDISGTNFDSQLSALLTARNRYYFGITNYSGKAGGAYTWQVAGPSGAPADDSFENNDSLAQASNLGTLTAGRTINNLVMADAADWYRFTTAATGTASNSVAISFLNAQGDLDLELYNTGGQRLRLSTGVGNTETVSLSGLAAGTYVIKVYGFRGATNPNYSLSIKPPGPPASPPPGAFDIVVRASGLTASQQQVFNRAAARWEQVITGDLPDATYQGVRVDDLLIDARARAIDGRDGVLAESGPDTFRSGSQLPYHGTMQFDSADLASLESSGQLYDVVLHEMGHVLGIGTIWQSLGLLTGMGATNPRFVGARATAEYNALFRTTGAGVPVEGLPSEVGTRDAHWRESIFGNELMTPYISGRPNPLSRVTVASLADLGYAVNLNAADAFTRP